VNEPQQTNTNVAAHLVCQECRRAWRDESERWRVYLTDDEPPEAVAYCSECSRREFG
jgi:hypothetical protein